MAAPSIAEIEQIAHDYYFHTLNNDISIYDWLDTYFSQNYKTWRLLAKTKDPVYFWLLGIAYQTEAPWKYKSRANPDIYVPPLASEANAASKSLFRMGAESGCKYSQYEYASVFLKKKDCSSALHWFLASAHQEFSPAMHAVGIFYLNSWGIPAADFDQAFSWVSRAAEKGLYHSQITLALFYRDGVGVPRDIDEAKYRLESLRSSGHLEAELYLSRLKELP